MAFNPTIGPLEILSVGSIIVAQVNAPHNDVAEFFCADEATVSITRAEALANAQLFVEAQNVLDNLRRLLDVCADFIRNSTDPGTEALAAVHCAKASIARATLAPAEDET